jgi:hypothetical protein
VTHLDLTEAIEAAAQARYFRVKGGPARSWEQVASEHRHQVDAEIIAAAPIIERQVRERIAAEIKQQAQRYDSADEFDYRSGMSCAAHIALGKEHQ